MTSHSKKAQAEIDADALYKARDKVEDEAMAMATAKHQTVAEKPPFHLLPFDALEEVAKVLAMGAQKYGERNWEKGLPFSQTFSAQQRHMKLFFQDRKDYDVESGLLHTAHIACRALFLLAYQLREIEGIDDRPGEEPLTPTEFLIRIEDGSFAVIWCKGNVTNVNDWFYNYEDNKNNWPFKNAPSKAGLYVVTAQVHSLRKNKIKLVGETWRLATQEDQ